MDNKGTAVDTYNVKFISHKTLIQIDKIVVKKDRVGIMMKSKLLTLFSSDYEFGVATTTLK